MAASTHSSRAYFEQQREALIGEIAMSFEQVLANINKLNRNLEALITVGNEFSSVEALWSTFENVMGKGDDAEDAAHGGETAVDKTEGAGGGDDGARLGQGQVKSEEEPDDDHDDVHDRTVTVT